MDLGFELMSLLQQSDRAGQCVRGACVRVMHSCCASQDHAAWSHGEVCIVVYTSGSSEKLSHYMHCALALCYNFAYWASHVA